MSVIKSFSVGNGDMFYIVHNSDSFSIIDCSMNENNRECIVEELKNIKNNKGITRFISTHPDEDHLQGIKYLDEQLKIQNFYCVRNNAIKDDATEDFHHYCTLRDDKHTFFVSKGCIRKWLNDKDAQRESAGIHFLWPVLSNQDYNNALSQVANGTGFNNISPIFTYSIEKNVVVMWMGDIEHDFLEKIKDEISWPKVDILFAPHHGRESGKVSDDVLKKIDPHIIVIGEAPSKDLNYYPNYHTIKQNSAGDIVFDCKGTKVDIYISNTNYKPDTSFLEKNKINDHIHGSYIGSFTPKEAQQ